MSNLSDLQRALYAQTSQKEITLAQDIQLGDNIFLTKICLEPEHMNFGIVNIKDTPRVVSFEQPIALDVLSDNIIGLICHHLRKEIK